MARTETFACCFITKDQEGEEWLTYKILRVDDEEKLADSFGSDDFDWLYEKAFVLTFLHMSRDGIYIIHFDDFTNEKVDAMLRANPAWLEVIADYMTENQHVRTVSSYRELGIFFGNNYAA